MGREKRRGKENEEEGKEVGGVKRERGRKNALVSRSTLLSKSVNSLFSNQRLLTIGSHSIVASAKRLTVSSSRKYR
jgi:hypothetical protein